MDGFLQTELKLHLIRIWSCEWWFLVWFRVGDFATLLLTLSAFYLVRDVTASKEGIVKTCLHTQMQSGIELSLLTALSIFPLIRALGQQTSLKGYRRTANCLIKKFGGARGPVGGAQKGPEVDGARSPWGGRLRRSTLIGNADPSRWPCLFTPRSDRREEEYSAIPVSVHQPLGLSLHAVGHQAGRWDNETGQNAGQMMMCKLGEQKSWREAGHYLFLLTIINRWTGYLKKCKIWWNFLQRTMWPAPGDPNIHSGGVNGEGENKENSFPSSIKEAIWKAPTGGGSAF